MDDLSLDPSLLASRRSIQVDDDSYSPQSGLPLPEWSNQITARAERVGECRIILVPITLKDSPGSRKWLDCLHGLERRRITRVCFGKEMECSK